MTNHNIELQDDLIGGKCETVRSIVRAIGASKKHQPMLPILQHYSIILLLSLLAEY